jgi:hypothetical protein
MTVAPRGYANPAEDDRRRALSRDPGSASRSEELAELIEEYSEGSRFETSELVAGLAEEATRSLPFADKTGPTGHDVVEANDNMSSVMDTALAASRGSGLSHVV